MQLKTFSETHGIFYADNKLKSRRSFTEDAGDGLE